MSGCPPDQWHQRDREIALAELRVARLEHQLAVAHLDLIGTLLRDGRIQPWGAMAAMADMYRPDAEAEGADPNE